MERGCEILVVVDLTEVVDRTHDTARIVAAADRTVIRIARYFDHVLDGIILFRTVVAYPTYDTGRTVRSGIVVVDVAIVRTVLHAAGVLLLGDSGVGKSETAIELVKRGHRLIADDAVEIKRVSDKTLVGTAPEVIRHFIELRGIGIVDVRRIFGIGAIKMTEKVELVINLEPWEDGKQYDRLGMDGQTTSILDIAVPSLTIPVKPGRNLAVIIEVAAMNDRQKKMGFNAAKELQERMLKQYGN